MKTFTEIEMLLDRIAHARKSNEMIMQTDRWANSDAGVRFVINQLNHEDILRRELYGKYPWHWIETVEYIISLRNKN